MDIAIPIFDDLTALDAVGPYEVLSRLPDARVSFVRQNRGLSGARTGCLPLSLIGHWRICPNRTCSLYRAASAPRAMHDAPFLDWIRQVHEHSTWTTSVCTGSLVLAAAGLLDGREATTHWLQTELLKPYGVLSVAQRVVRSGKIVTAAGVSPGSTWR